MANNVEAALGFYGALARGNVPGALEVLHPEIQWIEPDNFPYPGVFNGTGEVTRGVLMRLFAEWDRYEVVPEKQFYFGDTVVLLGRISGRRKATGRQIAAPFAHVWRFHEGKAVEFREYTDTASVLEALSGGGWKARLRKHGPHYGAWLVSLLAAGLLAVFKITNYLDTATVQLHEKRIEYGQQSWFACSLRRMEGGKAALRGSLVAEVGGRLALDPQPPIASGVVTQPFKPATEQRSMMELSTIPVGGTLEWAVVRADSMRSNPVGCQLALDPGMDYRFVRSVREVPLVWLATYQLAIAFLAVLSMALPGAELLAKKSAG